MGPELVLLEVPCEERLRGPRVTKWEWVYILCVIMFPKNTETHSQIIRLRVGPGVEKNFVDGVDRFSSKSWGEIL